MTNVDLLGKKYKNSIGVKRNSCIMEDNLFKRVLKNEDISENKRELVILKTRVTKVLSQLHGSPSGGHLGVKKPFQRIHKRFYWINSFEDVKDWCYD